jgi:hypothetical protein
MSPGQVTSLLSQKPMTNVRRILIVDDDADVRDFLVCSPSAPARSDRGRNIINSKGYKYRLTEKESAILRFLYRAGQRSVSREILLQEVGATILSSAPTPSRRTFTDCDRKSRRTSRIRPSW